MTEQQWLACTDPQAMLEFLRKNASERKLRLFACGCVRRAFPQLPDKRSRHILATVERYADGLADQKALKAAWASARWAARVADRRDDVATQAVKWLLANLAEESIALVPQFTWSAALHGGLGLQPPTQCQLIREMFGNPFHNPLIDPACLTWRDATIPQLAQAAYDKRILPSGDLNGARLAILADALEEAGCTAADLVEHLREPGPHTRSCWAVDRLLAKE